MMKRANINWNAKQIAKMVANGKVTTDNAVQRGYVWDINKQSMLILSMIQGYPIPAFYAIKSENGYDLLDGKQRVTTIHRYLNDEFALKIPEENADIIFEDSNGDEMETNVADLKFSELPEDVQDIINSYSLTVYYFEDITDEEISEMFFRLNNGKPLSAIELTRVRAKSRDTIVELSKHPLFTSTMTASALAKYTNEDMVIKSYLMWKKGEEASLETKDVRQAMESIEIDAMERDTIITFFDIILNTYKELLERGKKGIAKKLTTRIHMLSFIPLLANNMFDFWISAKEYADFCEWFFDGKPTRSEEYNGACASGTNRNSSVAVRVNNMLAMFDIFKENISKETAETVETVAEEVKTESETEASADSATESVTGTATEVA